MTSYFICASARTGTNLLATALRKTEIAGRPFEYFSTHLANEPFMLGLLGLTAPTAVPTDFAARLDRIVQAGTTSGGVFGVTLHWPHLKNLLEAIGAPGELATRRSPRVVDALSARFAGLRFIMLRRENKVAQAISHVLAQQTGRWYVRSSDDVPEPADVPFEFERIDKCVRQAAWEERTWREVLADAGKLTLSVTYEALAEDYAGELRRVLDFLGVALPAAALPGVAYRKQADQRSAEWEARYRVMAAAGSAR